MPAVFTLSRIKIASFYSAKAEILAELSRIFNVDVASDVSVQVLSASEFSRQAGSRRWAPAFYNGRKVFVRYRSSFKSGDQELKRILRLELMHVTIDKLSNGKCPLWLEEGLAQLFEGPQSKKV